MTLFSPVTALAGIGPARAKLLEKLNIRTLYDLIAYFPRSYEDRTKLVPIAQLEPDVPSCFTAMVADEPRTAHIRKGLDMTKLTVVDETGKLHLTFFNQAYLKDALHRGESYCFYGTLRDDYPGQMQNPSFEPLGAAGTVTNRILPVYALTAGLSNKILLRTVRQALDACLDALPEILPDSVRTRYQLCAARFAYETIHTPASFEALAEAKRRLVFEEFFIFSAGLSMLRSRRTALTAPRTDCGCLPDFYAALPFRLTDAQQRAIEEIAADLAAGTPMNRLVQGDVGSGKTMVAAAAAFCVIRGGRQAALMAPTEILAEQHLQSLQPLFARFGLRTVLLTGSLPAAAKRAAKQAASSGEAQLVIGTHALLTGDVAFADLGLVIADEQHRFGVAQRAALSAKGNAVHLLVMSATPIPRTLALIAYGDLSVSLLDELPPGRQRIDTFLVGEGMRARMNAFIKKQCDAQHQVYIVCPAVEETDTESMKSAEVWADTLQKIVFPQLRVGLLHGQMKGAEKESVMGAFVRYELDILVATTVIEVGVDVPNATLIVVENADRFGLSQLHQLRGRVGRGSAKSYCVLFTSNKNPETLTRLRTLCATNDGFRVAEQDLALRGPGDFFGSRQHGLPLFKVANLQMDLDTLKSAQQAAADYLQSGAENPALLARIHALFDREPVALN